MKKSKSAKIIGLLATTDLTREQIAAKVGCLPAYVRVVEQRLIAEPGDAPARRWQKRNPDRQRKYRRDYMRRRRRTDPAFRERQRQYSIRYYHRKKAEANA